VKQGSEYGSIVGLRRNPVIAVGAVGVVIGGLAIGLLNGGGGSNSTSASGGPPGGGSASEDTPRVPHNKVAAVYNTFGADPRNTTVLKKITDPLASEGYQIESYVDTIEGAGPGQGTATLDNFTKKLPQASVIIINTHGHDFSGESQECSLGKGLTRCAIDPSGVTTTSTAPKVERSKTVQPVLHVEWYPTWEAEQQAYDRYVGPGGGYDKEWLYDPVTDKGALLATTLVDIRPGDFVVPDANGNPDPSLGGARPWLGITKAGIEHFFKGKNIDFIDNLACHSMSMATAFDARSYFGHASTACLLFEFFDEAKLFDRLVGKSGVEARPTDKAYALGGFEDAFFQLAPDSKPVVLSPAVKETSPREGGVVKPGETTAASIKFDAAMKQDSADGIVSVSGCSGKVENPKWSSETELKFDITIPKDQPEKSMTVTVHQDQALADPGTDDNHHLDGDQDPADKPGLAPNRDDYVYNLSCTNAAVVNVEVRYTGTITADYTEGGLSYNVNFTWDETQVQAFQFTDGRVEYLPREPPTLTASGMTTTSGRTGGPEEACTYTAAPAPVTTITINARENPGASPRVRTADVLALYPGSAQEEGNDQLLASGSCLTSGRGPQPFLFYNPNGNFDPGGTLSAAQAAQLDGIDLDALASTPRVVEFPFEYTQPGTPSGSDHVVGSATLTVSLR
jgi:hypothetical protein